jgi:hypothetical protein
MLVSQLQKMSTNPCEARASSPNLIAAMSFAMLHNQEFYPAAAFVIWAVSICFVILYN